jgi:hypothetical protein
MKFLRSHPEVRTVFTSSFAPLPIDINGVGSGGGKDTEVYTRKIAGLKRTWRSLPKSVKHVIHIRDVPLTNQAVLDCVQRVIAEGVAPAGTECQTGRNGIVRYDTGVAAAKALHSRRYAAIDLTEYFCDAKRCYPVIGGARVYRDPFGHITTAYSRTLGPYLLRAVRRLMKTW